jgi:alkanesulfonate monooxygenase SsuD/methylene tetrahydromethanopterin reductase-like flavin-dependent oxidoreductase (luciferase family)
MGVRFGVFDQFENPGGVPLGQLYRDRIDLAVRADQAGFWGYHKSEHHMIPLDAAPSINVYLAAVSQRTERIRLCSLVNLLPFYHPLRLAEEICMLDQLSGGRFELGFGKGISIPEHLLWGLEPVEAIERTNETLDIVLQALQTEGDFSYRGRYWQFEHVPIEFAPVQRPYPPLWRPGELDTAAKLGVSTVVAGPTPAVIQSIERYHAQHEPGVGRFHPPTVGALRRFVVADTVEAAEERGRAAWAALTDHLTRLFRRYKLEPPGDPTLGGDYDKAKAVQAVVVGSPESVREHVEELVASGVVEYVIGCFAWGDLDGDECRRSFDLFAEHVAAPLLGPLEPA